jgi:hypothetical protein
VIFEERKAATDFREELRIKDLEGDEILETQMERFFEVLNVYVP